MLEELLTIENILLAEGWLKIGINLRFDDDENSEYNKCEQLPKEEPQLNKVSS